MKVEYPNLAIVDKEYLEELEQFKKERDLIYDINLEYKDIVNIDTYKKSFVRYLEKCRLSIANQRALSQGKQDELWGVIKALDNMIVDINNIDKLRAYYDDKKSKNKEK